MLKELLLRDGQMDRESREPLWLQLATILQRAVDEGLLVPDQALPSESELIDLFGVSRTVVREALGDLVRRGVIYKIRAKGSFVSPPAADLRFIGSTEGSSADLAAAGRSSTTRMLRQELGQAEQHEAEALQIAQGADVVRLRRQRLVGSTAWLLVDTTLPRAMFPGVVRANLENRSLYEHLRRHYGVTPTGADRWIQAVIPDPADAELLDIEPGVPVLRIESVSWNAANVPFEYYRALHRSDKSRFYVGIR